MLEIKSKKLICAIQFPQLGARLERFNGNETAVRSRNVISYRYVEPINSIPCFHKFNSPTRPGIASGRDYRRLPNEFTVA